MARLLDPNTTPAAAQFPSDMPTTTRPMNAGSSVNDNASRLDGPAKVSGQAKYGRDVYFANGLYIGFLRCPYGAADLETSDDAAAKAIPGVVDVEITRKEGKYHGHKMGQVVGESPLAVKRGLRALKCKWARKPVKTRITDTVTTLPAPGEKTTEAFKDAELKLEAVYTTPVQPHSCLETHGASIEFKGESAVVYASTQGTSAARDGLDKQLGLPQSAIQIVCEYVGGGFGSKLGGPGKECQAAAGVAAKFKKHAYMFDSRSEDQTDTGNRPSSQTLVRIAFKKDGTITGGEIKTWGGTGVGGGGGGCNVPSGRYNLGIRKERDDHQNINHNGGGPMPARAPAFPQGAFAEELMLDEIAALVGIDPRVIKHKLASKDIHREMFDLGAKMIGWSDRKPTGSQTGSLRIGYGVGTASWHTAGPGGNAEVAVHQDGSVEARSGTQDPGTGTRTMVGIVAAAGIGVPLSAVTVRIGHSGLPSGPASGGSNVTPQIAPTMELAAKNARDQILAIVAKELGAEASEFDIKDGVILRKGTPHMQWKQVCAKLPVEGIVGKPQNKAEAGQGGNEGVQFVKLSVDAETGVVHPLHVVAIQSCGKVIFRKGAESQVIGSVIQGISNALFERQVLDRNVGTMLNDNLESYKILGPYDMPKIETVLWTHGQTGVRGIGEPPIVATSGAVACAIFNAIGRPVRDLPMTPDRILAAMEGAKS
jgi:xanthine dehydrogenase YagR molybdenum-binding subunit